MGGGSAFKVGLGAWHLFGALQILFRCLEQIRVWPCG